MSGFCECGCGEPAPIATRTDARAGSVKGQPRRFISQHHNRIAPSIPAIERVERRCVYENRGYQTPCRIFTGYLHPHGYGKLTIRDAAGKVRPQAAHRITYQHYVGPIPEGLELDHLCRQPACCEVTHLEAVTHAENVRRGASPDQMRARHAARTHCKHGHPFDEANTGWKTVGVHRVRVCRECANSRKRAARRLKTA